MRAILLRWPATVTVRQARHDAPEVELHPFRLSSLRLGVIGKQVPFDVDPGLLVTLERVAHGRVVQLGVHRDHLGARVAKDALDDELGHPGVDEAGPRRYL